MGEAENLKAKLKAAGVSQECVDAVWPSWWSEEAEFSPSAVNDLRFSVARKLGFAATSLFEEGDPIYVWHGAAKFKGLGATSTREEQALIAFGASVARHLTAALPEQSSSTIPTAKALRDALLKDGAPWVALSDILAAAWGLGIAVIHLQVFPLLAKRMAAMTVRAGDRYAILLARNASYPAPIAFILAHEIGHIHSGHLADSPAIVDADLEDRVPLDDAEEGVADAYALELLTGHPELVIQPSRPPRNSTELQDAVSRAGRLHHVEPGTLALCYAYRTGEWRLGNAALSLIYQQPMPVQAEVNGFALSQLQWDHLPEDSSSFLGKIMGL